MPCVGVRAFNPPPVLTAVRCGFGADLLQREGQDVCHKRGGCDPAPRTLFSPLEAQACKIKLNERQEPSEHHVSPLSLHIVITLLLFESSINVESHSDFFHFFDGRIKQAL